MGGGGQDREREGVEERVLNLEGPLEAVWGRQEEESINIKLFFSEILFFSLIVETREESQEVQLWICVD